jgi:hypothetical protein
LRCSVEEFDELASHSRQSDSAFCLIDAQTPTPTPIQTVLFAPVPANDNTGIGIGKFDAVTGAVINAILSPN